MMLTSLADLPIAKLKQAVALRERIEALKAELNQLLGDLAFLPDNGNHNGNRNGQANGHTNGHAASGRGLSAAGRARIAEAQRLRWAKYNA